MNLTAKKKKKGTMNIQNKKWAKIKFTCDMDPAIPEIINKSANWSLLKWNCAFKKYCIDFDENQLTCNWSPPINRNIN